jgi:hypothetical protein
MEAKTPVLLVVLVETSRLRWFVAAIGPDGEATPLLRSEEGDLDKIHGLGFDDQVSFLRHRFCGVLQRGCDRLWARQWKAYQFVFVFEGPFPGAPDGLTRAVADHFAEWLLNPPVVVYASANGFGRGETPRLDTIAGAMDAQSGERLHARVGKLLAALDDVEAWELSPKKRP